jgi:hypothetical protein
LLLSLAQDVEDHAERWNSMELSVMSPPGLPLVPGSRLTVPEVKHHIPGWIGYIPLQLSPGLFGDQVLAQKRQRAMHQVLVGHAERIPRATRCWNPGASPTLQATVVGSWRTASSHTR